MTASLIMMLLLLLLVVVVVVVRHSLVRVVTGVARGGRWWRCIGAHRRRAVGRMLMTVMWLMRVAVIVVAAVAVCVFAVFVVVISPIGIRRIPVPTVTSTVVMILSLFVIRCPFLLSFLSRRPRSTIASVLTVILFASAPTATATVTAMIVVVVIIAIATSGTGCVFVIVFFFPPRSTVVSTATPSTAVRRVLVGLGRFVVGCVVFGVCFVLFVLDLLMGFGLLRFQDAGRAVDCHLTIAGSGRCWLSHVIGLGIVVFTACTMIHRHRFACQRHGSGGYGRSQR